MKTKKIVHKKKDSSGLSQPDQTEYWAKETDYELAKDHPHRQLILDVLKTLEPFAGVLEVGCNIGQNLERIQEVYPETQLAGIDVNQRAIETATQRFASPIMKVGDAVDIPFADKSFDVVIYDAILMYVKDIDKALDEALRVGRKTIIILDWEVKKEKLIGHSLARNYEKLLANRVLGFQKINITYDIWPNEKWQKYGRCFVVHLVLPTSTIN